MKSSPTALKVLAMASQASSWELTILHHRQCLVIAHEPGALRPEQSEDAGLVAQAPLGHLAKTA